MVCGDGSQDISVRIGSSYCINWFGDFGVYFILCLDGFRLDVGGVIMYVYSEVVAFLCC